MKAAPKLPMHDYIGSKEKKQIYVNQMFSTIAPRYDLVTALLSYGQDARWKRRLVAMAGLEAHHQALDLACGTGDITFLLAERLTTGSVTGVDITPGMIEIANQKKAEGGLTAIHFQAGDICKLGFAANMFDCITVGYGVRNVPDISQLLKEVFRLLKPGGRFLSLDFGKPSNPSYRWIYLRYLGAVGSLIGWLLHRDPDVYRYISESLKLYPGQEGVQKLMQAEGFVKTGYITFLGGATAINFGGKPAGQEIRPE
jgi:demethylmenaquinone methyltransferase/2-methoxy-6-polyprenyl-1,4-benzoquinol methylase